MTDPNSVGLTYKMSSWGLLSVKICIFAQSHKDMHKMRPWLEIFFSPSTKFPVYTIYRPSFFDNLSNNTVCFPPHCNTAVTILLKSNKLLLKVRCSKSINIKSLRLRVVYFLSLSSSVVSWKPLSSLRIYLVINLPGPKTKANTALYIKLS